ncbi:MAG: reverse transcriptase family protein, partial [Candidatus Thiodiazotropha sp.]
MHTNKDFFYSLCLKIGFSALWIFCLILLCGDVHTNPGPDSVRSFSLSSSSSSLSLENNHNFFSILHLNVQSLAPKIDLVRCESAAYDVMIFTESWLNQSVSNDSISIEHFHEPLRYDRNDRIGGGVTVYIRNTISFKRRYDLEIPNLEAVWVEISLRCKTILIGGFYRPPNSPIEYFNRITESFDRAYNTNINDIVILGDFNYNMQSTNNNKIHDLMQHYNLKQLIQEPTHFTESSESLIDLILVRNVNNVKTSGVYDTFLESQTRFHCPVICILKFNKCLVKSYKRRVWNYDKADFNLFRNLLSNVDWNCIINENDIEKAVENFTNLLIQTAEKSIPNKIATIRPNEYPWINGMIRKLIRKRKRLYRRAKRSNVQQVWQNFKKIRNTVIREIRKSKQEYFNKLSDQLNAEKINPKLFWKISKQLLNLDISTSSVPPLNVNGDILESDLDKATALNSFFAAQSTVDDSNAFLPAVGFTDHPLLNSITITNQEVLDVLHSLNISKSCGPDLINPRLLKEGAQYLQIPLTYIFNSSLRQCQFPNAWKKANVTPIHKKNDKTLPNNYRPISLLSTIGKVMERCVHKHIYNYVIAHNLITPFQSGFIRSDSTTNQLLYLYHSFCEAVDSGKEVRVVFCDISKAFDRVWHRGLLFKLSSVGIKGNMLKWFSSYLSNRTQRVVLNGQNSEWVSVKAGVPQGSILGPLLFLLYINDIVNQINTNVRLFADDTSLYIIVDTPERAAVSLNSDLQAINQWATEWLVDFNPSKTFTMTISRKTTNVPHPPLFLAGTNIQETDIYKHLGLHFSNNLSWSEHIRIITQTAWQRLSLLRGLKFRLKRFSLEKIYISFVRPLLEYSDSVWDNLTQEEINLLESVHTEAARIVSGATKLCNIERLLSDLSWEPLYKRRRKHRLVLFYKMVNHLTPDILSDLVPPYVRESNPYSLRNADDIQTIHARTNLYFNSFLPATVRDWNNLPLHVRQSDSVETFKKYLNSDLSPSPSFYNAGSRLGQVLHTRLRLECSSLNAHLYSRNLVDSPLCVCGEIENTTHFIFNCPNYS